MLQVPFLTTDHIRDCAIRFLADNHPGGSIPVPIERIIEHKLGINIIPTPGLHLVADVDGFITSDLQEIYVDEFVFAERPNRYHYTLAHEIAHVLLHGDILGPLSIGSIDEWREFSANLDETARVRLEWQANACAGHLLAPTDILKDRLAAARRLVPPEILRDADPQEALHTIAGYLSREFKVSTRVIEIRIEREHLWS